MKAILCVVLSRVRRLMKFRDHSPNLDRWVNSKMLRPLLHPLEKINEPLASNVIADKEKEQRTAADGRGKDKVHISVAKAVYISS